MSIVVTVRRPGPSPLSREEIVRALKNDPNFALDETGCWRLTGSDPVLFLNVEEDEAWTDGSSMWLSEPALGSLRGLASQLHARVFSEDNEDITLRCSFDEDTPPKTTGKLATVLGGLLSLVLLPVLLIVAVVRLPWILWQITRAK
ncbi:MAG: hypothetical protein ACK4KV_19655 [Rhodocyclaceae bacterium]